MRVGRLCRRYGAGNFNLAVAVNGAAAPAPAPAPAPGASQAAQNLAAAPQSAPAPREVGVWAQSQSKGGASVGIAFLVLFLLAGAVAGGYFGYKHREKLAAKWAELTGAPASGSKDIGMGKFGSLVEDKL